MQPTLYTMDRIAYFAYVIMPPFFCTVRYTFYTPPNIRGNVLFGVCHIRWHMLHKYLHMSYRCLSLCCCPNSLTVLPHNKQPHIPCLIECISPSFLNQFPVCTNLHNDYKWLRILNMTQYKLCTYDNLSLFLGFISEDAALFKFSGCSKAMAR